MTSYLAITTCNERQWAEHGRRMATSFARYWPSSVPLRVYAEGFRERTQLFEMVDLDTAAPWLGPWKAARTSAQRGVLNGRYNYRLDAARFVHKVAAIGAAAESSNSDVLIWMDADVVPFERASIEWLARLLPADAPMAWLDRATKYPECGFLMFRLPACRELVRSWVEQYRIGEVFKLPETHDSFVLQHLVKASGITPASLSGDARNARHTFISGPLGAKLDHLKGARKAQGRSHKSDLIRPRPEAYWR